MVKHTQTIRRQQPTNCLTVFDHFVGLALEGLLGIRKYFRYNFMNIKYIGNRCCFLIFNMILMIQGSVFRILPGIQEGAF